MARFLMFLLLGGVLGSAGCWKLRTPDDDDVDGDADSDTDVDGDVDADGDADGDADCPSDPPDTVDLLVMVDNSGSMAQEQAALTTAFGLAIVGLEDVSLHVGVISPDMGTGGYAVQTCRDAIDGDDGILRSEPSGLVAGCEDAYPTFLSQEPGDDPAQLDVDFACVATLGTGGCGFEQQLKAVRKALTVHADGANDGFLRDDSLLGILMITDEEDCSVREDEASATDIFNTQLALGPLNLRCYNHRDQYVTPVEDFVGDLLAVRPCTERLAVAGIVGIPPGIACSRTDMGDADYQCILDSPEMQEVVDNSAEGKGERLTPSCDEPGLGEAFPPRRIVEFIRQLDNEGAATTVQTICDGDFGPGLQQLAAIITDRLD